MVYKSYWQAYYGVLITSAGPKNGDIVTPNVLGK
jgi:hypothetical protein